MNILNRTVVVFFGLFLSLVPVKRCAGTDEATSPGELVSRARVEEELWTDGTPPLVMRAEVQLLDSKGALARGDYIFYWVSPSQWREEIGFGNYKRIRVGDAKGYWQESELKYQPEVIFHLDTLLQLKKVLKASPEQTWGKVKRHEKERVRQNCTEVNWTSSTQRILCFREDNGVLTSVEYPTHGNSDPPEISRIEYGAFHTITGKLVPYEIRAFRDTKTVATVKVLEITTITEPDSALFAVPANAEFWPQCDDMREAELVNRVQPIYSQRARINGKQGRVVLYAVVEPDGSLSHLTIIHRADRELEGTTVEAVRHWHYKPAVCGQTPIRLETYIETDFWLQ